MPMAVHRHDAVRHRREQAHEPAAIDQRGADPLRERLGPHRILDRVVMQPDHPARAREGAQHGEHGAEILFRHEAERVGEGEMRLRIGVQQDDAEPVRLGRRQHHREDVGPEIGEARREPQRAGIGEGRNRGAMRRQRLVERRPERLALPVHDADAGALHGRRHREHPHLAQALAGARRQFEPGRIGPVDDVDVVVAGQDEATFRELGVPPKRIEEFGPFRRTAGIGHVAADQQRVQRLGRMNLRQSREHHGQPVVAARAGAAALDAEAVALSDHMDVGEMRDAPAPRRLRHGVEAVERARLVHPGVGNAPDQRGDRQIETHHRDGVGERRSDQAQRMGEIDDLAGPARRGPRQRGHTRRDEAGEQARRRSRDAAQLRTPRLIGIGRQETLRQMAQAFAEQGVDRLDRQRIQSPEAALGRAEQRPEAVPPRQGDESQHEQGPEARDRVESVRDGGKPGRRDQRREPEQDAGDEREQHPGEDELGQVDLAEQAPGDRQERPLFRAAEIVLGIAVARFDDHAASAPRMR